jgi:hypothetical protein
MPRRPPLDGWIARGLALLVFAGCVAAIACIAREAPKAAPSTAAAAADQDCAARARAEIERLKAEGRLTAEQAMIRRQKIASSCR